ncbi:MAG: hypothetical protein JRI25_24700 [Deltaproteobacteria bacterium]|nr:hypothetical protein [Deltaproteobacteria bacterium]
MEWDIRAHRKFSLAEVIGREGGDFLKGESPVPPHVQAIAAISGFVDEHVPDVSGALRAVLQQQVRTSELEDIVVGLLEHEHTLYEFVRRVDFEGGRLMLERPHFQQPGQPPHPEDEYTHESVRAALTALVAEVRRRRG